MLYIDTIYVHLELILQTWRFFLFVNKIKLLIFILLLKCVGIIKINNSGIIFKTPKEYAPHGYIHIIYQK